MKFRLNFYFMLLIVSMLFLSGCEPYDPSKEGVSFVPIEDIFVEDNVKGIVTLDSIEGIVIVNVEGLAQQEDYYYEAWILDKETEFLASVGVVSIDSEGEGELTSEMSSEDILNTRTVMITLEPDDADSNPSEIVILEESIPESADVIDIKLRFVGQGVIEKEEPVVVEIIEEPVIEVVDVEIIIEGEDIVVPEEVIEGPVVISEEDIVIDDEVIEDPVEPVVIEHEEEVVDGGLETVDTDSIPIRDEKVGVLIVSETDLVKLKPQAYDPDNDGLTYDYTSPIESNGEWQTTYGDIGEYTITVTVSDGSLSDSKDVLILVNKREESPSFESYTPEEGSVGVSENSNIEFIVSATDLNDDELKYSWKLDGLVVSSDTKYVYNPEYDDAGGHFLLVTVSDGTSEIENEWVINVDNVNRRPTLVVMEDIHVRETETVVITPEGSDFDGDELSYTISDPVGDDREWETSYDDAGEYHVVISASDGIDSDSITVRVVVENVNRAPVIEDIILG
ncbi:MAG: anti-sigma factor [Candidatus Woesearchaeota archaeon]|nr:anti-sigma factor [Candidatus Woesearchaeota archaeon]